MIATNLIGRKVVKRGSGPKKVLEIMALSSSADGSFNVVIMDMYGVLFELPLRDVKIHVDSSFGVHG